MSQKALCQARHWMVVQTLSREKLQETPCQPLAGTDSTCLSFETVKDIDSKPTKGKKVFEEKASQVASALSTQL